MKSHHERVQNINLIFHLLTSLCIILLIWSPRLVIQSLSWRLMRDKWFLCRNLFWSTIRTNNMQKFCLILRLNYQKNWRKSFTDSYHHLYFLLLLNSISRLKWSTSLATPEQGIWITNIEASQRKIQNKKNKKTKIKK